MCNLYYRLLLSDNISVFVFFFLIKFDITETKQNHEKELTTKWYLIPHQCHLSVSVN